MAPTKPGTAAAAQLPRPVRKCARSATPSSSAAAEPSPSKSLPKAAPRKENIPLVSAQSPSKSASSKTLKFSAAKSLEKPSQLGEKRSTTNRAPTSGSATPPTQAQAPAESTPNKRSAATPDKTPEVADATPPGSRHSSRKRTQTPRAIESWALNKKKKKGGRKPIDNITKEEADAIKERIANRKLDIRDSNDFKPETQSEEEDEEQAIEEYHYKKRNSKEGALFWPGSDFEDSNTSEMDADGVKKRLKRPSKSRASLMKESAEAAAEKRKFAIDGNESESILYEIRSTPESESKRRKVRAKGTKPETLKTVEEESNGGIVEIDLSPSKKARDKKLKATADKKMEEAQKEVMESLSRMNVEQSEESDADEEPEEDGGKKKETHAEMLLRLAATRAKKTKYGGKKKKTTGASIANLINARVNAARVNAARLANPKPPRPGNQSDADDSDTTIPPVPLKPSTFKPSPSQPQRRTSRRAELAASSAPPSGKTRSSAEPHVKAAHLDSSGEKLEYRACPYFYEPDDNGRVVYPQPWDEKKNKIWKHLYPIRARITENGKRKLVSGLDTVLIDTVKTNVHPSDIGKKSEELEMLPDTKKRKNSKPEKEVEQDLKPAKIIDVRLDTWTGKRYVLIAWYWTRKQVQVDLKGFPGYLNRRWPKEKPWEWMIFGELDVVCEEAIVSRIPNVVCEDDIIVDVDGKPGKRDERFCTDMVYGGKGLNYEIFGREVGLPGYGLDIVGVELNEEDRKTFKSGEDKKRKSERVDRTEFEDLLRFWFNQFWKTREYMDRHRFEVTTMDKGKEPTWGGTGDDDGRAYIAIANGGTGRLIPVSQGGLIPDPVPGHYDLQAYLHEDDDGMTDEKTEDEEKDGDAMDVDA